MKHIKRHLFLILAGTNLIPACIQKQAGSQPKITAGSFVEPHDPIYRATVSLDANGTPFCTGVLFDKRTVITAAHCIKGAPAGKALSIGFGSARTGNKVSIPFEKATQMIGHPNWDSSDMGATNINPLPASPKNDIGIVVLDRIAPEWTEPRPIKMIGPVNVGDRLVLAGFGQTGMFDSNGFNPSIEFRGEMRSVEVELNVINEAGWEFVYKPLPSSASGGSCHGDSGGPMFYKEKDGSVTLIGITSRGYSKEEDCNGRGVYTDARKFEEWIKQNRDETIKKLGPSPEEWQHRYIDTPDGTKIAIDYQLATEGVQRIAKTVWVNVTNPKFQGTEKLNVQIDSYINKLTQQNAMATYAGDHRFTVHMTEVEGQVVCTPHSRWGVQQSVAIKVNENYINSGQERPTEFEFKFCQ